MKILEEFDFSKRPSRSRYAPVVRALVEDNAVAVQLERGEDFPADVKIATASSGVRAAIKKAGKRAEVYPVDDDTIVVRLRSNGTSSSRRGRAREAIPA
jgi:hypothetical protein